MSEERHFAGWAILELLGHRRLAGYVEDVEMFGGRMLRLDVFPGDAEEASATQFYSVGSLYAITPVTAEVARALAVKEQPRPVATWELPRESATGFIPPSGGYTEPEKDGPLCECGHGGHSHLDADGEMVCKAEDCDCLDFEPATSDISF